MTPQTAPGCAERARAALLADREPSAEDLYALVCQRIAASEAAAAAAAPAPAPRAQFVRRRALAALRRTAPAAPPPRRGPLLPRRAPAALPVLQLPPEELPPRERALRLLRQGVPAARAAALLRQPRGTVTSWAHAEGIALRPGRPPGGGP